MIVYTALLENLQPHTYYYVRVTAFIKEMGITYNGTSTQESGPFLTKDEGMWLTCT